MFNSESTWWNIGFMAWYSKVSYFTIYHYATHQAKPEADAVSIRHLFKGLSSMIYDHIMFSQQTKG